MHYFVVVKLVVEVGKPVFDMGHLLQFSELRNKCRFLLVVLFVAVVVVIVLV